MKYSYSLVPVLLVALPAIAQSGGSFTDNFLFYMQGTCFSDGTSFGPWTTAFTGFGCAQVESTGGESWLDESPGVSTSSNSTHSALVVGPSFSNPLVVSVQLNTVAQLRQNSQPSPWEVGWVVWHYTNNSRFYYFIAEPNGWELGKENGSQTFLATGTSPTFPIGNWYNIRIEETRENKITVYVNNQLITTVTDSQNPYTSGSIGLYDEDAHVKFEHVAVTTSSCTSTGL